MDGRQLWATVAAACCVAANGFLFAAPRGTLMHVCAKRPRLGRAPTMSMTLKSWDELRALTGPVADRVVIGDTLPDTQKLPTGLILFRDRNGWCPYSERVWLAMLAKQLDFDEVLINLQGSKPRWYSSVNPSGQTPCVRTAEGKVVTESLRIIEDLDAMFPDGHHLFPQQPAQRQEALDMMHSFSAVFPSGTRPSSRGSFLFTWGGRPLPRAAFEATLDQVERMLEQKEGFFFFGETMSGVDCAFAPFLERWAHQVPALIGLEPRDPSQWPALARWYDALEALVPAYSHRVQGDRHTWRAALDGAGGGATSTASDDPLSAPDWLEGAWACDGSAWSETFVRRAPAVGPSGVSAARDAAARLVRNREAVVSDVVRRALSGDDGRGAGMQTECVADLTLRAAVQLLVGNNLAAGDGGVGGGEEAGECGPSYSALALVDAVLDGAGGERGSAGGNVCGAQQVRAVARHIGSRICTPRDMGALPALRLRQALRALDTAAEELCAQ